jgi:hypothetical protein
LANFPDKDVESHGNEGVQSPLRRLAGRVFASLLYGSQIGQDKVSMLYRGLVGPTEKQGLEDESKTRQLDGMPYNSDVKVGLELAVHTNQSG